MENFKGEEKNECLKTTYRSPNPLTLYFFHVVSIHVIYNPFYCLEASVRSDLREGGGEREREKLRERVLQIYLVISYDYNMDHHPN